MKPFFKKLFLICLCCYGLLFVLQYLVDYGIRKSGDGDFSDWNRIMKGEVKEPMVFLGSSRADAHFDPILIEQYTGIPSYNLGSPAASLPFQKVKWKSYLEHNHPKIVIQNIDLHALWDKNRPDKRYYLPYYNDRALYNELQKTDPAVLREKWLPMSKYRGFEEVALQGITGFFRKSHASTKTKGHHKHYEKWNSDFDRFKKHHKGKPVDYSKADFQKGLYELEELLADCKKNNAQLILVWTPAYFELSDMQQPSLSKMKAAVSAFAKKNNLQFWDFSNDAFNRDKKYFYNAFHMNDKGVAVFCRRFSDSLNVYLKKPTP